MHFRSGVVSLVRFAMEIVLPLVALCQYHHVTCMHVMDAWHELRAQ
jgi:hypothetical protein